MISLFSTVATFLFFLGLSISTSPTSTTITSISASDCSSLRLLGKWNSSTLIRVFSILLTIRQAVDS